MNRLVVVSNRVPLPSAGSQAGGLAVALDGLMEKRGGLWFGWSGAVSPTAGAAVTIARHGDVDYATIDLTQDEHDRYYNNFSNGVLWPLLHTMPALMHYDRQDARAYRDVNNRMAAALQPLLRPNDLVWIHDYHMLPLAAALRARGVQNPLGFFLHIPFAGPDVLAQAPEMASLVRDMLSADLIGFQTDNDQQNFLTAATTLAGATRLPGNNLQFSGPGGSRRVRLGVFPVEIDAREFSDTAAGMADSPACRSLARSIGEQTLILGVDRLDPTKGLPQRITGLRRLLEKHEEWRRRITYVQIAAISRKDVASYRDLRDELDSGSGQLNADLGEPDWQPLRLVGRGSDRSTVAGYMRLARIGLVTPLRDGMNLVAKEYVAAQDPRDPGVLILSRFAGAARQLDAAVLVNPHDPDAMADGLDEALRMPQSERIARWKSLWQAIESRSPIVWGRSFVATLMRAAALVPVSSERPARAVGFGMNEGIGPIGAPPHLSLVERIGPDADAARQLN